MQTQQQQITQQQQHNKENTKRPTHFTATNPKTQQLKPQKLE